jgi:hypothetical protein
MPVTKSLPYCISDRLMDRAQQSVTDTAVKAGVRSCAGRINQVTNFLTTVLTSGAVFSQPPSDPDKRLVSFSLGLKMRGGKVAYASESFAPNQANGCGSEEETVVYWEAGCGSRPFLTI